LWVSLRYESLLRFVVSLHRIEIGSSEMTIGWSFEIDDWSVG